MGCARATRRRRWLRATGTNNGNDDEDEEERACATWEAISAFPLGGYSFTDFELEDDVG